MRRLWVTSFWERLHEIDLSPLPLSTFWGRVCVRFYLASWIITNKQTTTKSTLTGFRDFSFKNEIFLSQIITEPPPQGVVTSSKQTSAKCGTGLRSTRQRRSSPHREILASSEKNIWRAQKGAAKSLGFHLLLLLTTLEQSFRFSHHDYL